ncbi:MAG TPA: 6-bladed beta-propeller [Bacteroidetes bacterium]|nr:6-bladed beta-propeller [Bacteroidota bacterium]
MKKTILLFFLIIFSFSACSKQEWHGSVKKENGITIVSNPQTGAWEDRKDRNIKFVKKDSIGKPDGPDEYLFAYIVDIEVNRKGEIFVADRQMNNVRKFDQSGKFLLSIGQKGKGPGEFESIKIISLDNADNLLVFDNMLGRVSVFSADGAFLKSKDNLIPNSWISPAEIFVKGEYYIFFAKIRNRSGLFHGFDKNWHYSFSFGKYEFIDNKEFEEFNLGFWPGQCYSGNDGSIFYTKYYYDNRIFVYQDTVLKKIIRRDSDIKVPYEVTVMHDVKKAMDMQKDRKYDFYSFGQGIAFVGYSFQTSAGIFQLNDGRIVNFIHVRKSKQKREFGVELYDKTGKFLQYAKLGENTWYTIFCKDANDAFYTVDRKGFPKVLKFEITD